VDDPRDYAPLKSNQPQPPTSSTEQLFEFDIGTRRFVCRLKFCGESYGWDAQFFEGTQFRYSHRFALRDQAIKWAESQRAALQARNPDEPPPLMD
jgi:hypothetical protein